MLCKLVFGFLFIKIANCQINGDFWWLNKELEKIKGEEAPAPQFEELSEFDTDESSKIIFREDEMLLNDNTDKTLLSNPNFLWNNINRNISSEKPKDYFVFRFPKDSDDKSPRSGKLDSIPRKSDITYPIITESVRQNIVSIKNDDYVNFKFPSEDDNLFFNKYANPIFENTKTNNNLINNETAPQNKNLTENICIYIKKTECTSKNGLPFLSLSSKHKYDKSLNLVCCIFRQSEERNSKIVYPDSLLTKKRYKRSQAPSTNQRDFLMRNKFPITVNPIPVAKTDDEYVDPYWNIKNTNFKIPKHQNVKKHSCDHQDYEEDYVSELPRPGLLGVYSDDGPRKPAWTNTNDNPNPSYEVGFDYSDEDDGTTFGYSTVDPRRVSSSKAPKRRTPIKLSTTPDEEEVTYDIESQTNTKRGTSDIKNDSDESLKDGEEYKQVFENCGHVTSRLSESEDKEMGEANVASHPWLATVATPRKPEDILCYATIVHPRAAITAGDCVNDFSQRTSTKDAIAVFTGLSEIAKRSQAQNRIASVQMHPQWKKGRVPHNLAILHWKQPLRLNPNVQPACLTSSIKDEDCMFYGWGGFDQALRKRVHWQKATLVSSRDCSSFFSKPFSIPKDSFCATVKSRGTVTGLGGSLICHLDDRASAAGVAIYRDNAIVLIPAQEWLVKALEDLNID